MARFSFTLQFSMKKSKKKKMTCELSNFKSEVSLPLNNWSSDDVPLTTNRIS